MGEGVGLKLMQAMELADGADLSLVRDLLARNDHIAAADELRRIGDERGDLPPGFWDALRLAYHFLGVVEAETLCGFREHEARFGVIEARLTLLRAEAGGRRTGIATDYRPSWDIGNRTDTGEIEINDARVTLEDRSALAPGETGLVRLHPLWPDGWRRLQPGARVKMQEGARVVGHAEVIRVALKGGPTPES